MKFTTLPLLLLALTTLTLASVRSIDQDEQRGALSSYRATGYAYYLQDAPVQALDETVTTFPEYAKPGLYLSDEGLFRYVYYEKTGIWLDDQMVTEALAEPYDQGNW